MRDPFAVGCRARQHLPQPEQKALILAVGSLEDGLPAWSYAAQLCALFDVPEDAQERLHEEAGAHRAFVEGHGPQPR